MRHAPVGILGIDFDTSGKLWFDTMHQGLLGELDPQTGKADQYPMPAETNMRTAFVDNRGDKPVFWVGSSHTASLVKVEPLD